jgi:cytidine deaminase
VEELPLTLADRELFVAASRLIDERFALLRHHVAAAVRGASGAIYTGLHVGSRRVNICAEPVAISAAIAAGEETIVAGLAVIKMESEDVPCLTSPCGVCRELLTFYNPEMTVVVDAGGQAMKTRAADLLPAPWLLPAEGSGPLLLDIPASAATVPTTQN